MTPSPKYRVIEKSGRSLLIEASWLLGDGDLKISLDLCVGILADW
jgi:hypothetical protein